MRSSSLRLAVGSCATLLATCGGPPPPTPASDAVQALVDELTAELERIRSDDEAPFHPTDALQVLVDGPWQNNWSSWESGGAPAPDFAIQGRWGELHNLGMFLTRHSTDVRLEWVVPLGVEASSHGEHDVQLVRAFDEQRFLLQLASQDDRWVVQALDPMIEEAVIRDASAEEFAQSWTTDFLHRHLLMGGYPFPQENPYFYWSLAGPTCSRSLLRVAGPSLDWAVFEERMAYSGGGLPIYLVEVGVAIHEGDELGWQQSMELARVALREDGKVEAKVRLVQQRGASRKPRAYLIHLLLERNAAGLWCLASVPVGGERIATYDLNFAPDTGRWQVQLPQRF